MKPAIVIIICALLLPLAAALVRTLLMKRRTSTYAPDEADAEAMRLAGKLSAMVRCDTTSYPGPDLPAELDRLHETLAALFPLVHEKLEHTDIDGNLFYFWKGKSDAQPIVLMSHQDVVPAEGRWTHEPFSGDIADGLVWGRGSADTKCTVMAFFEAAEQLLHEGYQPECDVYLISSCTEEWSGEGAPKLVAELKRRGAAPYLVCDEGGAILTDPIGGIKGNFAMVGVLEKGIANVRFSAKSNGGHSSMPGKNTPIARLAALVQDMEKHPPFKKKMLPEVKLMFSRLAPYAPFGLRLLMGNLWLFAPLMTAVMGSMSAAAGAMLQTTAAFTMQSGSDAFNVLPQEATLGVNLRFIPHQGMKESLGILEKLAKKHGVDMELVSGHDYCEPVDVRGDAFAMIGRVIERTFPGLPAAPYIMTGGTDARFLESICPSCIRFAPVVYGKAQMKGMHGIDENIGVSCLPGAVLFYKNLIRAQAER